MTDKVFVAKNGIIANGTFLANSTVVNAAAITATSLNAATVLINEVDVTTMISGNVTTILATTTSATRLTSGTLPNARLDSAVVNTSHDFTIAGKHTYSNTVIFANTISVANTISANGSTGTAGYILTSAGASSNAYWAAAASGVDVTASYTWTGAQIFSPTAGVVTIAQDKNLKVGGATNNTTIQNGTMTLSSATHTAIINSTSYNATSNNSGNLDGRPGSHYSNSTNQDTGTLPIARLGTSGTANSSTFLCGNNSWQTISQSGGTGTVTNIAPGTGLTSSPNPIIATGTISLGIAGPGNGNYGTNGVKQITLDNYGRVTAVTAETYLLATGIAADSNKLGNYNASDYLRITGTAYDSARLGGTLASSYLQITGTAYDSARLGGTLASSYLQITGTAYDSARLGSYNAGDYLRSGNTSNFAVTGALHLADKSIRLGQTSTDTPGVGNQTLGACWQFSSSLEGATMHLSRNQYAGLRLNQQTSGDNYIDFYKNGSAVAAIMHLSSPSTAYFSGKAEGLIGASDYRLKTDLKPVNDALQSVTSTPVYSFLWKTDTESSALRTVGFLAHEIQKTVPTAVYGEKDGAAMQHMDVTKLIPTLWAAVCELSKKVEELELQINTK